MMKKVGYTPQEVIKMLKELRDELLSEVKDVEKDEKMYAKRGNYTDAADCQRAIYTLNFVVSIINQKMMAVKSMSL